MTSPPGDDAGARPAPGAGGEPEPPVRPGGWLTAQRQARGWALPEMARRLRDAAKEAGDPLPTHRALVTMVRRWERGAGVSERYRLHYCRAFGLPVQHYGTGLPPVPQAPGATLDVLSAQRATPAAPASPAPLSCTVMASARAVAYRGSQEREPGRSWIWREVMMTAHESSEHAEQAERREIGDATLEQLRADVVRLSHDSMTGEPFAVFQDMRRVRNRMHAALDRRLWPRDQVELYFLLGCLNGLMSAEAWHLGSVAAAEELIRAAWAYAIVIDDRPLLGHLRLMHADVAYWNDEPRQCLDLAGNGLEYLNAGPNGALLHLTYARAAARLGDDDGARQAVAAAHSARDRDSRDDLLEIGGEFSFTRASQHYFAGSALINLPQGGADAIGELEQAIELYDREPESGEQHSAFCMLAARVDLATANLCVGRLDAAVSVVDPVLTLSTNMRVSSLPQLFRRTRRELAQTIYRGSAQARELDERIELFCRETVVADLHSLPGGS